MKDFADLPVEEVVGDFEVFMTKIVWSHLRSPPHNLEDVDIMRSTYSSLLAIVLSVEHILDKMNVNTSKMEDDVRNGMIEAIQERRENWAHILKR